MIRVLVVDDHAVVRTGLRLLLDAEDDIEVISEAANGRDAIFEARTAEPDVILLDVVMPGESGIDVTPKLLHEQPDTKILVLSMQDDPSYVRQAFAAGAAGYVLKEAVDAEVVAAVREVAGGGRYVNPALGARLVAAEAEERARAEADPLDVGCFEQEHDLAGRQEDGVPVKAELLRIEPRAEGEELLRLGVLTGEQPGDDHQRIHAARVSRSERHAIVEQLQDARGFSAALIGASKDHQH